MNAMLTVESFLCEEFAPDMAAAGLPADLNLIESGVLDSLGLLKLVAFLENQFNIIVLPEELDVDHFNSMTRINEFVESKRNSTDDLIQ